MIGEINLIEEYNHTFSIQRFICITKLHELKDDAPDETKTSLLISIDKIFSLREDLHSNTLLFGELESTVAIVEHVDSHLRLLIELFRELILRENLNQVQKDDARFAFRDNIFTLDPSSQGELLVDIA